MQGEWIMEFLKKFAAKKFAAKTFAAKNFTKKIIGLGMAVVMAFGGFAADAVRFQDMYNHAYIDIVYCHSIECYTVEAVRLCSNEWACARVHETKLPLDTFFVNDKALYFCIAQDDESTRLYDDTIEDYINRDENLKRFIKNNVYVAPDIPYDGKVSISKIWKICDESSPTLVKNEIAVFNYYMKYIYGKAIKSKCETLMCNFYNNYKEKPRRYTFNKEVRTDVS